MFNSVVVFIAVAIAAICAQQACQLTDPDILGPYYIAGAPKSEEQLCANLPAHDRLVLTGQVVDYDSSCLRGIPYVQLDLWQANYNGVYSAGKSETDWFCRGVFRTDANGNFRITTLMPGRYDDGGYRPAHIHFNITAEGYPQLVTQLYFTQDYYLSPHDSCARCRSDAQSLRVTTVHRDDIKTFEGSWPIVLSKKPRISFPPLSRSSLRRGSYKKPWQLFISYHAIDSHGCQKGHDGPFFVRDMVNAEQYQEAFRIQVRFESFVLVNEQEASHRNQNYQLVAQREVDEYAYLKDDEDALCANDGIPKKNSKSILVHHLDNINMKEIQEILPLVIEPSLNVKIITPPVTSYTNDTRPDVDLLEC